MIKITPEIKEDIDWSLQSLKDQGYKVKGGVDYGKDVYYVYIRRFFQDLKYKSFRTGLIDDHDIMEYFQYSEIYDVLDESIDRINDLGFEVLTTIRFVKKSTIQGDGCFTIGYIGCPFPDKFENYLIKEILLTINNGDRGFDTGKLFLPVESSKDKSKFRKIKTFLGFK